MMSGSMVFSGVLGNVEKSKVGLYEVPKFWFGFKMGMMLAVWYNVGVKSNCG